MIGRTVYIREPCASWSARFAIFAALLIGMAIPLHRLSVLTTPVTINTIGVGFVLAGLALACGLYATVSIWIRGRTGAWSTATGVLISLALWMWPVALLPTVMTLPHINDISTDTKHPPAFTVAAKLRTSAMNKAAYPGAATATLQQTAYPDIKSFVIPRPVDDVYELALDLVRGRHGLGWKVLLERAPQIRPSQPGVIEATDRTLILGFTDDISIRFVGNDAETHLDIRSASRYGQFDFGTNAARIRHFVRELATRLDQTGPVAGRGGVRINNAEVPAAAVKSERARTSSTKDRTR